MSSGVSLQSATALLRDRVAQSPERPALRVLRAGGAEVDAVITWAELYAAARRFAAALIDAGVLPGERVAILAGNRPHWPIADLGALLAGCVSVGLYPTSAPAQVRGLLADCRATVLVVDSDEQLEKARAVRCDLPDLRIVVAGAASAGAPGAAGADAIGWEAWLLRGESALAVAAIADELERRADAAGPDDLAMLIYTSGSTGEPKGARIPHRYLLASAVSIRDTLGFTETDSMLSFLPYCHAAERVFGLWTRILCGMEAGLVADPARVWEAARAFSPTVFGGLPRLYEKVHEAIVAERAAADPADRDYWDRVLDLGRQRSRVRRAGAAMPPHLEETWRTLGEPLFQRVRDRFGGRVRLATSGGAALPENVAETLDALDCRVLGGYGLTEHLCAAFNRTDSYTFDSAGPAMPGTQLRIAEDGEVLIRRCDLTFDGYWGREQESRDAFTADGEWLLTGDLGSLDERGMLRITGRKKELIALSTGKKVAPVLIEARLVQQPWIAQAMLYGEGKKFVTALLVLRRPVVEAWACFAGIANDTYGALLQRPEVLAHVQASVDLVNAELSRTESVRRFVLLERELSPEAGELTPTMKIRRAVVAERHRARLDALYD